MSDFPLSDDAVAVVNAMIALQVIVPAYNAHLALRYGTWRNGAPLGRAGRWFHRVVRAGLVFGGAANLWLFARWALR